MNQATLADLVSANLDKEGRCGFVADLSVQKTLGVIV
jgi:hypothetical protein